MSTLGCGALVLAASLLLLMNVFAQANPADGAVAEKQVLIKGKVLARVHHLTGFSENLLGGLLSDAFVFGALPDEKAKGKFSPIKVSYNFYRYEPFLPEKFFDFSLLYQLNLVRDRNCDETVESLSYEEIVTESRERRDYILKYLD